MSITIEITIGELLDRLSILCVKMDSLKFTSDQLNNEQYFLLNNKLRNYIDNIEKMDRHTVKDLYDIKYSLEEVNKAIFWIEERIRTQEMTDSEYASLSRECRKLNDKRFFLKKEADTVVGVTSLEVKTFDR